MMYRDRAYCSRSYEPRNKRQYTRCANTACDRFAGPKVLELASKAGVEIGWADLWTSKCGFIRKEKGSTDEAR